MAVESATVKVIERLAVDFPGIAADHDGLRFDRVIHVYRAHAKREVIRLIAACPVRFVIDGRVPMSRATRVVANTVFCNRVTEVDGARFK